MNERYKKLSDKIAKISRDDIKNLSNLNNNNNNHTHTNSVSKIDAIPSKSTKLERKIQNMEEHYKVSMETLDSKYCALKDHINKLKMEFDDEKLSKEELTKLYMNEIKQMGNRVNYILNEEREYMSNYNENLFKKLETSLLKLDKTSKLDYENLRFNVNVLKEQIDADMIMLKDKLETENKDREGTIDTIIEEMNLEFNKLNQKIEIESGKENSNTEEFSTSLQKIITKVRNQFDVETADREKFEENIIGILHESTIQLSKIK